MSVRRSTAAVSRAFALMLTAFLAAGCGGEPVANVTEPSAAKGYLTQALDAWKSGEPLNSLANGSPAIQVNDRDWEHKSKLTDYKLDGDGEQSASGVKWTVPLTLSVKGKTVEKQAVYAVNATDQFVSISRQDLGF